MEVLSSCVVCASPAGRTCALCGRAFCDEHMNSRGVCVFCAGGKAGEKPKAKPSILRQRKGVQ